MTQRSAIMTAIRAALAAGGGPAGLTVSARKAEPIEGATDLPLTMVGRMKEATVRAVANKASPVVKRSLTVRLDHWVAGDDPEEALEALLAWATAVMLANPGWNAGALASFERSEDSTQWDLEMLDLNFGHAIQLFTVVFTTKTADQEQKQ